jgi:hypothetical protein
VQDRVHRLIKEPCEEAQIEVEQLRQSLSMEFFLLESHPEVIGLVAVQHPTVDADSLTAFDNLDGSSEEPERDPKPESEPNLAGPS